MNGPLETISATADGRPALAHEDELTTLRARVEELERASAERKWMDDALKGLAFGTASSTGHEFLQQLVRELSATLQVPYVFVTELAPGRTDRVRTVAGWYRDRAAPLLEYALADSPCQNVIQQGQVFIPCHVQRRFPKDEHLARLNLESYLGVPLLNGAGQPTGHLCVTDVRPFLFNHSQGSTIITAFAGRAAAELERLRAENSLRKSEERFRALYDDNPSMYFTLSATGTVMSVNAFGAEQLGYSTPELIGRPVLAVFDPRDHQTMLDQLAACAENPYRTFEWELQKVRKDGSRIWVRERARAVINTAGHISISVVCNDITAQHQALDALRESEGRLYAFASAIPDLAFLLDEQGRYVEVLSQEAHLLYANASLLKGRLLHDVLPRADADLFLDTIRRTIETGQSQRLEYPLQVQAGLRWFEGRTSLMPPVPGKLQQVVWVARDITERKQTEELLRESQTRLAFVLSHSPAVIYTAAASGEFGATFVSANITAQLGYEPQEFTNDPRFWADRIHPDDASEVFNRLSALFAQGTLAHEYRFLNKQGQYRWMHDELVLIRDPDGQPVELLGSWLDITERKQTEELLRVSEERFAKAFRSSPHPVIVTERETGLCLEVNDAGLALFGYQREEVIGQTVLTLRLWPTPEERTQFFARLALAGSLRNVEVQLYAKDRTPRQCLISCEPIEIGGKACLVTVGTDITEQKRAEEAVRLQERILQQAREERERISQDLHDNILQSLYAVGMQLEASKLVAGTSARKSKTHVTQAIAQLNQLVQEVRHFIALLHQRNAPIMDFERTLRQLAGSFSSAGHNAPTLIIQPEAIPLITANVGEQLLSIAREALSNSMRHAKASTRSMTLRLIGSIIQLRITDDGIGFKPGQKRRRGQGLRNMATRAAHIGARFLLASAPGQGTSVTVEVPLERPHEPGTI